MFRPFIIAGLLLLIAWPIASASTVSQPSVYYLADDKSGPAAQGVLETTPPNASQPSVRLVPAGISAVSPVEFQTLGNETHAHYLIGPVYTAVWMGPSPIIHGNLSMNLMLTNKTGAHSLLNRSFALDANTSAAPAPTAMVPTPPAVPPTDPQGYATYVAYYELAKVLPAVTPPARLIYLGFLNMAVQPDDKLSLGFSVVPNANTTGGVLSGAGATIEYAARLSPSFIYVPWYEPVMLEHPVTYAPAPYSSSPAQPTYGSQPQMSDSASGSSGSKGSPGPELALVALAVAGVAVLISRRKA